MILLLTYYIQAKQFWNFKCYFSLLQVQDFGLQHLFGMRSLRLLSLAGMIILIHLSPNKVLYNVGLLYSS